MRRSTSYAGLKREKGVHAKTQRREGGQRGIENEEREGLGGYEGAKRLENKGYAETGEAGVSMVERIAT